MLRDDDVNDTFYCGGVGVLCVTRDYRRELFSFEKKKRETKAHSCRNSIEFDALFESEEGKRSYKEKRLLVLRESLFLEKEREGKERRLPAFDEERDEGEIASREKKRERPRDVVRRKRDTVGGEEHDGKVVDRDDDDDDESEREWWCAAASRSNPTSEVRHAFTAVARERW